MGQVIDAIQTFWAHLAEVRWEALGFALGFHLLRLLARLPAWRNIIRAAYPGVVVPWRGIAAGYFAGVGLNSIIPARSGDVLRLYIVRHRVEGSTYVTLAATTLVETLFDVLVATGILTWAIAIGVLPSLDLAPTLPEVDWAWIFFHPKVGIPIVALWAVALALLGVWVTRRIKSFWQRVGQGFTILGDKPRYLRQVVTWQALSWGFRFASVYAFLEAFNLPATPRNTLLVLAVQSLATLLPLTPGGVGTSQGLLVYVFRRANLTVSDTAVVSFSVGMQIATTALNLVLGLTAIFLTLGTLRWKRVVGPDRDTDYARDAP